MLNGLDLFSGIGGISIALADWVHPVAYCDIEPYARAVLHSRMCDGGLARAPVWDDVCTLRGVNLPPIDIIYGGFPCQDISVAGRGAGLAGERSGLVFEVLRLVDECAPAFVFLENVPAIRTRGGERVVKELAERGYDCRWDCLSASDVGAPHRRQRWFLLAAHTERLLLRDEQGRGGGAGREGAPLSRLDGTARSLADADGQRLEVEQPRDAGQQQAAVGGGRWWSTEPDVGRVAHGVSARAHRLRGLGNAVVPAQVREAFRRLSGL